MIIYYWGIRIKVVRRKCVVFVGKGMWLGENG